MSAGMSAARPLQLGICDANAVNDILQGFDHVAIIFCAGSFNIFFNPFEQCGWHEL